MTSLKATKRALFSSAIALVLCFAMLLGTTFAWFTDSAVSAGNKVVTGNLDVELYQHTENGSTEISESQLPVFEDTIIWEPGMTEVRYLSIKNAGSLALKYKVALEVSQPDTSDYTNYSLADVMTYEIIPDAKVGDVTAWGGNGTAVVLGANATTAVDVALESEAEHFFAIAIHMDEEAGNMYMNKEITFDIKVLAGQLASEEDSFGNTYDEFAGYPGAGYAAPMGNSVAAEIKINDGEKNVGSILIPAAAAKDTTTPFSAEVKESDYVGNFTVGAGVEKIVYDVAVEGLKENNDTPVKVQLRIAAGLDPDTVSVYHYDTLIDSTYNPTSGYVTFETLDFSPFTILFDAQSEFDPSLPEEIVNEYPVAKVTYEAEYVNTDLEWGNIGGVAPTPGLDSKLEAAFKFACPDYETASEEDKAIIEAFREWHCDFYVSLDRELAADQIFLGGNYGEFGWIGFHNGDITLAANEEIPLLGSVTANPWIYADIEQYVGEFICGVGDVADALDGATFTVNLRLTNPENEAEFYNVNTVTYTFGGSYEIK